MREYCGKVMPTFMSSLILLILCFLLPSIGHTQCTSGHLEGQVFLDEDINGSFDNSENGVSGILVSLYDNEDNLINTTFTNSTGSYAFTGLTNNDSYRVEVSYLQTYASSHIGTDHKSDTRYAQVPNCDLRFGLTDADIGCSENPQILVTCFVRGNGNEFGNNATIVGLDYQFNPSTPVSYYATKAETGSIWGLAYDDDNYSVYSSAFIKQYASLTQHGSDAIFKTDLATSTTNLFVKLSDLGINTGILPTYNEQTCDYAKQVGMYGIGNIVISNDGSSLFAINIYENTLVKIPLNNPSAANVQEFNIPDPNCTGGEARSFALESHNGKYYIGVTCDGSIALDASQSTAYVYEFNEGTQSFVEIFQTDAVRGYWNNNDLSKFQTSGWLTDIDFTDEGNMLLAFSDRYGHSYCDGNYGRVDQQNPDLLVAWNDNGTWKLENNGVAGNLTGSGVNNGDGPGGGEFFGGDFFLGDALYHNEISLGSIFALPGSGEIISTVYDPILKPYSGGLHRYNTSNGQTANRKELYIQNFTQQFGKATGFGEITAVCPKSSPEIGNLVWYDANADGIQGPEEARLANVSLVLYDDNCQIVGRTTTDTDGVYAFNSSNVSNSGLNNPVYDGIFPNKQYYIAVDPSLSLGNSGFNIGGNQYNATQTNSNIKWGSDLQADSQTCSGVSHLIPVMVGSDNAVDHRYDIGFILPQDFDLALMKQIEGSKFAKIGEPIIFNIDIYNQGNISATQFEISDYLNPAFTYDPSINPGWVLSGNMLKYKHQGTLAPFDDVRIQLRLILEGNPGQDFTNYAEISNTVDQLGNVNSDMDSTADDDWNNDLGAIPNGSSDDEINDNGTFDEDDHDVALIEVMDLALRKTLNDPKAYRPGDLVTFDVTVINQGNVDVNFYSINDYYPQELLFLPQQNTQWSQVSSGVIKYSDTDGLAVGQSKIIQVTFQLISDGGTSGITNAAEIADARSLSGNNRDFDSTPDNDGGNDVLVDDETQDNGVRDEDDHDIAVISREKIDLALMKTSESRIFLRGSDADFTIRVYNQGDVVANNIKIVDYLPESLEINDSDWDYDPATRKAYYTITLPNGLAPGDNTSVEISTKVSLDAGYEPINNVAEIMAAEDLQGNSIADLDCDSSPDGDASNDVGGRPNTDEDDTITDDGTMDEDDADPAQVFIYDFAIVDPCVCLNNATTSDNGQFHETIRVIGPSGDTWWIDFASGLFSFINSPAPPSAPVDLVTGPMGYNLVENPIGNGYSEYFLFGIHVDRMGYSVRVTNTDNIFIQIQSEGCNYDTPTVTTDFGESLYSACAGQNRNYSMDVPAGCSVLWTLPGGFTATTPDINYTWGGTSGTMTAELTCSGVCIDPVIIDVEVGGDFGTVACVYDLNVSLDGDCAIEVVPSMLHAGPLPSGAAYGVMLIDPYGDPISNNFITADYIGQTLTAKLIEPCSGNSCWANLFIEDKQPPTLQLGDISLPCWQMDTYMPLAIDNCGEVAMVIQTSETVEPLPCDDDFTKFVTRCYQATDSFGNTSTEQCQMISVERFDFSEIITPPSFEVNNGSGVNTALSCSEVIFGEDGTPSNEFTGVPTLPNGDILFPFPEVYCNVGIKEETITISEEGCVKKWMRIWTVFDGNCGLGAVDTLVQTIEVQDNEPPVITCDDNLTLSTSGATCDRQVVFPPPSSITDDCSTNFIVDIKYPGGILQNVPNGGVATLPVGEHMVTYTAYDACGNTDQCIINVIVSDQTSPTAICDEFTVVGLRGDGTADVFATTFDDGSVDDCGLYNLLVRRMDPPTDVCECDVPYFHNTDYLGEYEGHFYYLSKVKHSGFKSFAYANAMGGHPAIIDNQAENTWIRNKVDSTRNDATYWIGLTDRDVEGDFRWSNNFPVNYTNWNGGMPINTSDYVIVNADGTWSVATTAFYKDYYVLEVTDRCSWSEKVNFCCADAGEEQMVALRAIDYSGLVNNCMVTVEIQDKIPPVIVCPQDTMIRCDEIFDLADLSEFGEATATDGCGATLIELPVAVDINQCGVGEIKRSWIALDANGVSDCSQIINITSPFVFEEDQITWPMDYFSDQECNSSQLNPENLPEGFSEPIITKGPCDLVGVEFEDNFFFFAGDDVDACFKVLRNWTVIDWCTFDEDDSDLNSIEFESTDDGIIPGYFTYQQTIKISNSVAPVITAADNLESCTFDCDFGDIELIATATDDCTPPENMVWQYEINLFQDGTTFLPVVSGSGSTIVADGSYPVGTHFITYTFEDRCGNMVSAIRSFTIKNCKLPTAACIDGLSIGLEPMDLDGDGSPDTEMACLPATSFDASSNHPCGFDIVIKFCEDPSDPSTFTDEMCFDCADCGTQTVTICVIDEFDNVDFCTTTLEVQDNNNVDFCPNANGCVIPPPAQLTVSDCMPSIDPDDIGGRPTITADCFCDDFTMTYTDAPVAQPNADCLGVIRTWRVVPDCGCTNVNMQFIQNILIFNQLPPTITSSGNLTVNATGNNCEAVVNISAVALPGDCSIGANAIIGSSNVTNSFNNGGATANGSFQLGITPVTFTVTDDCGRTAQTVTTITVVDNQAPTCNPVNAQVKLNANNTANVTVAMLSNNNSDACGDVTTEIISGGGPYSCANVGIDNIVVLQVTDEVGNFTTCESIVTVVENEPPVCVTQDITVAITTANGSILVQQSELINAAQTSDNCPPYTLGDAFSFTCANLGDNVVSLVVSDGSGNTTECTATVTVEDEVAPTCNINDITVNVSNMPTMINLSTLGFTSEDGCGSIMTEIFNPFSLDCGNLGPGGADGTMDVTVTVIDENDNESHCTAVITITEQEELTCGAQDITIDLGEDGTYILDPVEVNMGSSAGCDNDISLTLDRTDFGCNDLGTTVCVTLTVTDSGGASTSCKSIVTVTAPIVTVPAGICPPDVTISCGDDISDLSVFGDFIIDVNTPFCLNRYTQSELDPIIDLNDCGTGTITRTLFLIDLDGITPLTDAAGNLIQCVQTITVEPGPNSLSMDDITCPADVTIDCTEVATDPVLEDIVDLTGVPCADPSLTFTDVSSDPGNTCNFTITRTIVISDACQPGVTFECMQMITVADGAGPVIANMPVDQTINLTGLANACSTTIEYVVNVSDVCNNTGVGIAMTGAPGLISGGSVDANGNATFMVEWCTSDGTSDVLLTATDICGNMTTETFSVEVIGEECFSTFCEKFPFTLEDDGDLDIPAEVWGPLVTFNSCNHLEVDIAYSPDINDDVMTYGCDDITVMNQGNVSDSIYFFLDGVLVDSCRVVVFFENDWPTICGFNFAGGSIRGRIRNEDLMPVNDAEVQLMGSPFVGQMTSEIGVYAFPNMSYGGSYSVEPEKDGDDSNGVSTLDLIMIQKHILGAETFDSPYDHIAADINASNSVSGVDVVQLRKLILGIYEEFPDNTSWRMVDAEYVFPDPEDPLQFDFDEKYSIDEFSTSMNIDFVGVKIGDINKSATTNLLDNTIESRSSNTLKLNYFNRNFEAGDEFIFDLNFEAEDGLEGAQFTLKVDNQLLEVVALVTSEEHLCTSEELHLIETQNNYISTSWHSLKNFNTSKFYSLKVRALATSSLQEALRIEENMIRPEAYFDGKVGELVLLPVDDDQALDVVLYQNTPNPWSESTSIKFYLSSDQNIVLNIFDVHGSLIRNDNISGIRGMNEVTIHNSEISATGVLYYELLTNDHKFSKKMLLLK